MKGRKRWNTKAPNGFLSLSFSLPLSFSPPSPSPSPPLLPLPPSPPPSLSFSLFPPLSLSLSLLHLSASKRTCLIGGNAGRSGQAHAIFSKQQGGGGVAVLPPPHCQRAYATGWVRWWCGGGGQPLVHPAPPVQPCQPEGLPGTCRRRGTSWRAALLNE